MKAATNTDTDKTMMNEFDQKAPEWDKNRMHADRAIAVAAKIQKMIPLKPGMKAMEFGAGTGLLSFCLEDCFSEITLVDSSREMLKVAEQKLENGSHPKFRTLYLDLESGEYGGDPFDIVYSQMVLHHIGDVHALFGKLSRLLKPGGYLAVADLYKEDGGFHDGATNVHPGFDPGELNEMIAHHGFIDFQISPCYIIRKEVTPGNNKEYPVFLMTAQRPEN